MPFFFNLDETNSQVSHDHGKASKTSQETHLSNKTKSFSASLSFSASVISHLFFDMSDKDAGKFIENVGYGFASGFLFQNNIPIPEGSSLEGAEGAGRVSQEPRGEGVTLAEDGFSVFLCGEELVSDELAGVFWSVLVEAGYYAD